MAFTGKIVLPATISPFLSTISNLPLYQTYNYFRTYFSYTSNENLAQNFEFTDSLPNRIQLHAIANDQLALSSIGLYLFCNNTLNSDGWGSSNLPLDFNNNKSSWIAP